MTDDLDHLDDDTLSAVLDGDGSGREAAHAAACPTCAARLRALRLASEAIGQPIAIDPDQRDAAIRAALVTPMAISLDARRRGPRLALAGAAAALVVAIIALPLATRDSKPTQSVATDQASTTFDAQAELRTAAPEGASEAASDAGPTTTTFAQPTTLAEPARPALGELADADLRSELAGIARSNGGPPAPCEERARAALAGEAERTLSATATWNGAPALVLVLRADGTEHAYVLTQEQCEIVESVTL